MSESSDWNITFFKDSFPPFPAPAVGKISNQNYLVQFNFNILTSERAAWQEMVFRTFNPQKWYCPGQSHHNWWRGVMGQNN